MRALPTAPTFNSATAAEWLRSPHTDERTVARAHDFGDEWDTDTEAACGALERLVDSAVAAGIYGPDEQQNQRLRVVRVLDGDGDCVGVLACWDLFDLLDGATHGNSRGIGLRSLHLGWRDLFDKQKGADAALLALFVVHSEVVRMRDSLAQLLSP